MKERPILFSGEMVQAILDGRKTQTRRVIPEKMQLCRTPEDEPEVFVDWCRYGQPGDRLWVRETWRKTFDIDQKDVMEYRAGGTRLIVGESIQHGEHRITSILPAWRPSIFMSRWASRITLEIVNVRVERVQDITNEDAQAEGITTQFPTRSVPHRLGGDIWNHRNAYARLWDDINSRRGFGWDVNPWVWVVEFKRL